MLCMHFVVHRNFQNYLMAPTKAFRQPPSPTTPPKYLMNGSIAMLQFFVPFQKYLTFQAGITNIGNGVKPCGLKRLGVKPFREKIVLEILERKKIRRTSRYMWIYMYMNVFWIPIGCHLTRIYFSQCATLFWEPFWGTLGAFCRKFLYFLKTV